MLEQLNIRNLATIESVSLELKPGFTALSGETGAGKSILLDAMGLVLGSRGDSNLVRADSNKAEVTAEFRIAPDSEASTWLKDQEMLDDEAPDLCIVRRVLQAEGKSRAFINGISCPVSNLRELGAKLLDIFGQNDSHGLRTQETQRNLLDDFAKHDEMLNQVVGHCKQWHSLQYRIQKTRTDSARSPEEIEFIRHQVNELDALGLEEGELERIESEHARLANSGRLLNDGDRAQEMLYSSDESVYDRLAVSQGLLSGLSDIDPELAEAESLVCSAQEQVREAADSIRRFLDRVDSDPERLEAVEKRLSSVHDLARKYRVRADELPARLVSLREDLNVAEASGESLGILLEEQASVHEKYLKAARKLSSSRKKNAEAFSRKTVEHVRELGMENAIFEVKITADNAESPRPHGTDQIEFRFTANPGQPPASMARVASGGELSRLSLAIQVVTRQMGGVPTMIFDEIDAGIGGGVAEVVGNKLRSLGNQKQVLCVTHLGQVAASAAHHVRVEKMVKGGQTFSSVIPLEPPDRVSEIARMIGGAEATSATRTLAKEMLSIANPDDARALEN